jgi:Amt family ammonium transporter
MNTPPNPLSVPLESARILQSLLSALNGIGYQARADEHWTMEFVSDGWKRLTGYEPEDVLFNRTISYEQIIHEDDRKRVRNIIFAALEHKSHFELEYRLRRADGTIRWVFERGTGVWNAAGELIGLEGIVYDISDRKQAEVASRESERRYQSLFLKTSDGIFRTSLSGRYLDANPALARIYGFDSPEELIAWFSDIGNQLYVKPTRRQEFHEQIRLHGSVSNFESEVYRRDGSIIWISETAHAVLDENGEVIAYEGMVRDISERKRHQQTLIAATEAAQAANRAKSEFLANISHEIRTPMNGILGMVDLLLDTPLNRTQSEYAATIRASATSLLAIIDELLDFSKIEAGKMELEEIELDVCELVEDVAVMIAAQALTKGLEVVTRVAPDVPKTVIGDPQRLKQCLINLSGNAVKFSNRGEVVISVACQCNDVGNTVLHFEVRDEGIGIPEGAIKQLFQPFVQADSSTTRRFGGTGLGLSIVHRLISMMQGKVGVESKLGVGSRFWFEVPLKVAPQPTLEPAQQAARARILIVDSSVTLCESLSSQLRSAGYEVEWRTSTESALRCMHAEAEARRAFDAVLVAWQEWSEPCAGLGERIHADPLLAKTRIVMMTPLNRHHDMQRFASRGFAGCITKPIRTTELLACLRQVLSCESREWHLQSQPIVTARRPFDPLQSGDRARRVLVVEDNPVNQKVAQRFLERLGVQVEIAGNGMEAIEMCRSGSFDLIFMDVQMPVMGGLEATHLIRGMESTERRTPIIALTAHAMVGELNRCLAAGMDDFLTKPLMVDQLRQVLEKYLGPVTDAAKLAADGAP